MKSYEHINARHGLPIDSPTGVKILGGCFYVLTDGDGKVVGQTNYTLVDIKQGKAQLEDSEGFRFLCKYEGLQLANNYENDMRLKEYETEEFKYLHTLKTVLPTIDPETEEFIKDVQENGTPLLENIAVPVTKKVKIVGDYELKGIETPENQLAAFLKSPEHNRTGYPENPREIKYSAKDMIALIKFINK